MVCVCGGRQKFNLWILEFGHGQTYLGYTKCSLRTICYSSIIFIYTLCSWITSVFHNKSGFIIMYEACSPFLNVCSHFSLKRKRLGIENWEGETFFGGFFRKRRKKNIEQSYGNYFMVLIVLEATTHVTVSGFSQTCPRTGWKQEDRKLNACTDELRRIPARTALVL